MTHFWPSAVHAVLNTIAKVIRLWLSMTDDSYASDCLRALVHSAVIEIVLSFIA